MQTHLLTSGTGTHRHSHRYLWILFMGICLPIALAGTAQCNVPDDDITRAISDALVKNRGVADNWITVQTTDGIVTLTGTTDNILCKDRAVTIAETVKGVRAVINNITVITPRIADETLAKNTKDALLWNPATDSWEIRCTADDGVVTLQGSVSSWQEKQLAARVVKGVRGVKEVKNRIDIDYDATHSDLEMKNEITEVFRWNPLIDDALIDVRVKNGQVTLSGVVGSAAEKSRAISEAWVLGVTDVNADNLTVTSWARDERFRKNKYVAKSEREITAAVRDALEYNPYVDTGSIRVMTSNGVVTLAGTVESLKARRSARATARNTVGVWRVKDYLKVRPAPTREDTTIKDRVAQALLVDPHVSRYDIDISVKNGIVNLSGTVDTWFEKSQADDVAANVSGVVAVNNNLAVDYDTDVLVYDPYLDYYDWNVYDYSWYSYPAYQTYTTTKTDWEIREDINDELFWSPFVDSDAITVTVDNGVATLTGTVETWYERRTATENAYEGGAVAVDNDLRVTYGPAYYNP